MVGLKSPFLDKGGVDTHLKTKVLQKYRQT